MKRRAISIILTAALLLGACFAFASCGKKDENVTTTAPAGENASNVEGGGANAGENAGEAEGFSVNAAYHKDANPVATITMNDGGIITIELFPEQAPNTVANFISLANSGFYNGLIFHRVIRGFMIQGGDPDGNGFGGPDYSIAGEFDVNQFANPVKHLRGTLSMARGSQSYDSAGSQFFICHQEAPHLDGQYAAFGQVIDGMDVVDRIAEVRVGANDKPTKPIVIKSIEVDLKGVAYDEPVTIR